MVGQRFDPIYLKQFGDLFHFFTAQAVNNSRLADICSEKSNNLVFGFHFWPYLIKQVGPVEGGFEYIGIEHSQVFLDVALNLWCGCGCCLLYTSDAADE